MSDNESKGAVVEPVSAASYYLRALVDTYYAVQNLRIQTTNRIGAYERQGLSEDEANTLHKFLGTRLGDTEKGIKPLIEKEIKKHPLHAWLKEIRGVGPCLGGSLVARIIVVDKENKVHGIERFNSISALWRYAGQAVIDGAAERKKKGERIHWDPVLKTTCWKIGEQFVKQGRFYRELYDRFKKEYREAHPEPMPAGKTKAGKAYFKYTDGHIHAMAKRKVVKIFLQHLWVKWRTMEGLEVSKPWIIEHGGHVDYIAPPEKG